MNKTFYQAMVYMYIDCEEKIPISVSSVLTTSPEETNLLNTLALISNYTVPSIDMDCTKNKYIVNIEKFETDENVDTPITDPRSTSIISLMNLYTKQMQIISKLIYIKYTPILQQKYMYFIYYNDLNEQILSSSKREMNFIPIYVTYDKTMLKKAYKDIKKKYGKNYCFVVKSKMSRLIDILNNTYHKSEKDNTNNIENGDKNKDE